MNGEPEFQRLDEIERLYAPEELPADDPEHARVRADEGGTDQSAGAGQAVPLGEPPSAAPVANIGTAPSAAAAPPNIGHQDHGGAPGDPETQAENPLDT